MAGPSILITGASGYIGGSVLTTILNSKEAAFQGAQVAALIRNPEQGAKLEKVGVKPVLFKGLDDTETIRATAAQYDVVINNASASHPASAAALIAGLADRKKQNKTDVFYIHTSGISSIADHPITKTYIEKRVFNDSDGDIYDYQKAREAHTKYIQRTTDITAVEEGEKHDVPVWIIMAPTIFGKGTGLFNTISIQVPEMIRSALKTGQSEVVGDGAAIWSNVHIEDLTKLYEILVSKVIAKENIPSGRKGIYFATTDEASWRKVAEDIGAIGKARGKLSTAEVKTISLEEAAQKWTQGSVQYAEVAYSSNSRTNCDLSKSLGWNPVRGAEWKSAVELDFDLILGA